MCLLAAAAMEAPFQSFLRQNLLYCQCCQQCISPFRIANPICHIKVRLWKKINEFIFLCIDTN